MKTDPRWLELDAIEPGDTVELSTGDLAVFFPVTHDLAPTPGYGYLVGPGGMLTVVATGNWVDQADRRVLGLAPAGRELSLRWLRAVRGHAS